LALVGLAAAAPTQVENNHKAELLLQEAHHRALVDGDLERAIELCKKIVAEHSGNRAVMAKALVQMGGCYEKLGQAEACKAYQRVIQEFVDQPESVARARARLAALGSMADTQQTDPIIRELKITYSTGGMALSPDGNKLAYCREEKGRTTGLVLRDLVTGDETDIAQRGTMGSAPVFSPDGSMIAYTYWSDNMTKTTVHIHSLETGEDQSQDQEGFVQDWSRDGRFLLIFTSPEFSKEGKTYIVPVDGGRIREVNVPLSKGKFSPDSQYISYSDKGNVYLYALDSGKTMEITKGSNPMWCPVSKTLLFLSQQAFGPESDLCVVSVIDGKTTSDILVVKPDFSGQLISLSQNGRLLYKEEYEEEFIYVADIDPETGQPTGESTRLATGLNAAWSPDGNRIAYLANGVLRVMSDDGSNDQEIIKVNMPGNTNFIWSPDNENIYMVEINIQNRSLDLYALSLSTLEKRLVLADCGLHLTCSPDGKHIAFVSLDESSNYTEIFMVDVNGENLRQLTFNAKANRFYPAWSPDGKYIVFESNAPNGTRALMAVSVGDGEIREIFHAVNPEDRFFMSNWSPDGNKLVFAGGMQGFTFRIGNVSNGTYQKFALDLDIAGIWPVWSPGGKKIMFSGVTAVYQLMILDNFLPESNKSELSQ
jgi:Tol biopolymer transport system component